MLTVKFGAETYQVPVMPGDMLSDMIVRAGIMPDLRCGGMGICGRCRVELLSGEFREDGTVLMPSPGTPLSAAACHTEVCGEDAEILVPPESTVAADGQIAVDYTPPVGWNTSPGAAGQGIGVAIDIGTTTVAVIWFDLEQNRPLASVSAYNRQAVCGDNVASRISYSVSAPDGLQQLRRLMVTETINPLLHRLAAITGRKTADVTQVFVAGNTVMEHIFLGVSPQSIGVLPFVPQLREFPVTTAAETGLAVNPTATVRLIPAVSPAISAAILPPG